ncbi:MAG TPA: hypothetical protein VK738_00485 [Terriglobales bacterium]|jgi:hypothetical protein|nr:hypothetical protein [Terriglobales bacterium]
MSKHTAIAAVARGSNLEIFGLGTDNHIYHKRLDGQAWDASEGGDWEDLGMANGHTFSSPPAVVAWDANRLDVFALNDGNNMMHKIWDGQWREWEDLGGVFVSPPAAGSWGKDRLDVVALGADNGMRWNSWDGANWQGWTDQGGGPFNSPLAVVAGPWGPGRLDVVVRNQNNQMYHAAEAKQFLGNITWLDWQPLGGSQWGGVFASPPAMVAWAANRLDMFALGINNQMLWKYWDGNNWQPSANGDWQDIGGHNLGSPPVVTSWGSNRLDLFALGSDNHMYHKIYDGGWKEWEPLFGGFNSPPVAISWTSERLDVFGLGADNAMYHKGWWNGGWQVDWTSRGGVFTNP